MRTILLSSSVTLIITCLLSQHTCAKCPSVKVVDQAYSKFVQSFPVSDDIKKEFKYDPHVIVGSHLVITDSRVVDAGAGLTKCEYFNNSASNAVVLTLNGELKKQ
jgi:hypothetical protein